MAFKRLDTRETLTIPIGDHEYVFEPVDADLGIFLIELASLQGDANQGRDPDDETLARVKEMGEEFRSTETIRRMLGPAYDQMREHGVDMRTIQLVIGTIMSWTVADRETAEKFWNHQGQVPKARKAPRDRKAGKARGR